MRKRFPLLSVGDKTLAHDRFQCLILTSFLALQFALPAWAAQTPGIQGAAASPTTLDCNAVPSAILNHSVNVCVALPSDYATSGATRYPVLYFLHGLFENERRWSERGGQQVLNDLIAQGQIGKFIVVAPDGGRTFWVNSMDGKERYEDFFIQELVPAIDKKYRTIPTPAERAISGSSMGGYGSLHIGMRHPDIFGSASAQSAALVPKFPDPLPTEGRWGFYARVLQGPFGSPLNEAYFDANNPLTLAEHPENFENLKVYFDVGDQDRYGFDAGNKMLDQILTGHNFPHEFHLRSGSHGWEYLNQYMKFDLLFHWNLFQQGEKQSSAAGRKKQQESSKTSARQATVRGA